MSPVQIRIFAATAGALLLLAAGNRTHSPPVMSNAANAWLNALNGEQKAKAVFSFNDEERLNWHFIPRERKGLSYRLMTPEQRPLAMALLNTSLSQQGFVKATSIMVRDPEDSGEQYASGPTGSGELLLLDFRNAVGERHVGLPI